MKSFLIISSVVFYIRKYAYFNWGLPSLGVGVLLERIYIGATVLGIHKATRYDECVPLCIITVRIKNVFVCVRAVATPDFPA